MLVSNALRLLAERAPVTIADDIYMAKFQLTNTTVSFRDCGGHVEQLRSQCGGRMWRPRTVTYAVRRALYQARAIRGPDSLLMSVSLDHHGRLLRPVACFMAIDFGSGPSRFQGWAVNWADTDALAMTRAILAGAVPEDIALEWLAERCEDLALRLAL